MIKKISGLVKEEVYNLINDHIDCIKVWTVLRMIIICS